MIVFPLFIVGGPVVVVGLLLWLKDRQLTREEDSSRQSAVQAFLDVPADDNRGSD